MAQLQLKGLSKAFRGQLAVRDLWLTVQPGEIVSLLGPSGCGKSTTLQLIAGIITPDRGEIELAGRCLNPVPPEKRGIALVLQRGLLFPHLSVGENVAFGLKMQGIGRAEREQRSLAMLAQVQLEGYAHRRPSELSGGQAQRVALARALVIQPQVLLLDEPLSALDANLRADMQTLILQLQAETGVTLLLVTHDQAEAVVLSHRIALMFDGCLRQVGCPETLYQQPQDETVARFFGGVNFFAATADQRRLHLPGGDRLSLSQPCQGPVQVTIRPEQIQVLPDALCSTNLLPVTVIHQRFTGTQRQLTLRTAAGLELQAWVPPSPAWAVGQAAFAHLPPPALWCFTPQAAAEPLSLPASS